MIAAGSSSACSALKVEIEGSDIHQIDIAHQKYRFDGRLDPIYHKFCAFGPICDSCVSCDSRARGLFLGRACEGRTESVLPGCYDGVNYGLSDNSPLIHVSSSRLVWDEPSFFD